MMNKSTKMSGLFAGIVTLAIVPALIVTLCNGDNPNNPPQPQKDTNKLQPKEKPIIIWYHHVYRDSPASLKTAISSGLISHIMIKTMHRKDGHLQKMDSVLKAFKLVKESGLKVIWCRPIWPLYGIEQSRANDLFDLNYYIQEIRILRSEGKQLGADFVALDTETYGKSPMRSYHKGERLLTAKDRKRISLVIERAVNKVGKVDFILPSGWLGNKMPYDILAKLGVNRISESTYYANYPRIKKIKIPYEIFGAYLNTSRTNKVRPKLPYFLVSEIFENSQLWSGKKGLFLYPKEKKSLVVAKELVAYSKKLRAKASQQERNLHSP